MYISAPYLTFESKVVLQLRKMVSKQEMKSSITENVVIKVGYLHVVKIEELFAMSANKRESLYRFFFLRTHILRHNLIREKSFCNRRPKNT